MNAVAPIPTPPLSLTAEIRTEHAAALSNARSALEHARRCGELLQEAKDHVAHGDWLPWLAANAPEISVRRAQEFMRLAAHPVAALSIDEALKRLAKPTPDQMRGAPRISSTSSSNAPPEPEPAPVAPDEPSGPDEPSDANEPTLGDVAPAEDLEAAVREYETRFDRVLESDEKLVGMASELKRLSGEIAVVKQGRDRWMNESLAAVRQLKAERRTVERQSRLIEHLQSALVSTRAELEQCRGAPAVDETELEALRSENERLRERIAIMEESAP